MQSEYRYQPSTGVSPQMDSSDFANPKDRAAQGEDRAPLDLLEPAADEQIARVLQTGANKYGLRNFTLEPIRARVYIAAMRRHLNAWLGGEELAADSGLHHLAHIGANVHVVLTAMATPGMFIDDRQPEAPDGGWKVNAAADEGECPADTPMGSCSPRCGDVTCEPEGSVLQRAIARTRPAHGGFPDIKPLPLPDLPEYVFGFDPADRDGLAALWFSPATLSLTVPPGSGRTAAKATAEVISSVEGTAAFWDDIGRPEESKFKEGDRVTTANGPATVLPKRPHAAFPGPKYVRYETDDGAGGIAYADSVEHLAPTPPQFAVGDRVKVRWDSLGSVESESLGTVIAPRPDHVGTDPRVNFDEGWVGITVSSDTRLVTDIREAYPAGTRVRIKSHPWIERLVGYTGTIIKDPACQHVNEHGTSLGVLVDLDEPCGLLEVACIRDLANLEAVTS